MSEKVVTKGVVLARHGFGWRWLWTRVRPCVFLVQAITSGVYAFDATSLFGLLFWLVFMTVFAKWCVDAIMRLVVVTYLKAELEQVVEGASQ